MVERSKIIALSVVIGGLVVCGIGIVVLTDQSSSASFSPFHGWGFSDWLIKVLLPILIAGGLYLLIVKHDSTLLKFTTVLVVIGIVVIGIGKGVSGAWYWLDQQFSSTPPASGVVQPGAVRANPQTPSQPVQTSAPVKPKSSIPSLSVAPQYFRLTLKFLGGYIVDLPAGQIFDTHIGVGRRNRICFNYIDNTSGHVEVMIGTQSWNNYVPLAQDAWSELGGSESTVLNDGKLSISNDGQSVRFKSYENFVRLRLELWLE